MPELIFYDWHACLAARSSPPRPALRFVLILLALMLLAPPGPAPAAALPEPEPAAFAATRQRLEALMLQTPHLATEAILGNLRPKDRWPANLLKEQQSLVEGLRAVGGERASLAALTGDPDPRLRTLALMALFLREDAHDLPLIAALVRDSDATFPRITQQYDGVLPAGLAESSQSVGDVAQAVLRIYLQAAFVEENANGNDPSPADLLTLFSHYWTERVTRPHAASWFLVKMKRAIHQYPQSPPLPEETKANIQRVLDEIAALPPVERAWTQLYVILSCDGGGLMPASELVASLREIGSDTLLKFLQRQLATDDPDLRPARPDGEQRRASALDRMKGFILSHARELLRATDADAVEAATTADSIMWRTAVSELRSLVAPAQAVASIKSDIAATALRRHSSQREQTALAASLWRIAGAEEKEYLTNWFYGLMPRAVQDGPEGFLRAVEHESRPDTQALLAAIVADARFAYTDWSTLRQLLHTVSTTLPAPLVELQAIYDNMPNSNRRDHSAALSKWRNTLRAHYGQPTLPVPSPPLKPQSVLASPAWAVPYSLYPTISADGRLLAAHVPGQRKFTLLEADTGKLLREKAGNESGWWVAAAFARDNPRRLFLFASHDGQREALNVDDLTVVQRDRERYASQDTVVNRALTRAVTSRVRFPSLTCTNLTTGTQLWAVQDDGPGEGSPVAISSEGKFVAVGGRGWPHLVRIYDGENGTLRRDITEFAGTVTCLAFSQDSRWLAVASQGEGVGLWDVTTGQLLRHLPYPIGDSAHLHGLAISDDGRWLAVVGMPSGDHPAGVFNLATGELAWEIHSKVHLNGLLFSPNGNVLYTYGQFNTADHPLVEAWPLK